MDAPHEKLTRLFPSVADIMADAERNYPDQPGTASVYALGLMTAYYAETRRLVLEADERSARKCHPPTDPPEDDDEDDTEDFDHGGESGDALAGLEVPDLDDECVFPGAAALPTVAEVIDRTPTRRMRP